jgi:hypothetical protein
MEKLVLLSHPTQTQHGMLHLIGRVTVDESTDVVLVDFQVLILLW